MVNKKKTVAVKGIWKDDWMEAKFNEFGTVRLLLDTQPPVIRLSGWKNGGSVSSLTSIAMVVDDDAGEINTFRAELDGNWIMFSRKDYSFIHKFDERTTRGKHELKVTVDDMAGNVTEKTFTFIR